MSKVLSQDEVDALLSGISGGEVETGTDRPLDTTSLQTYDFTGRNRAVIGKMPVLELIGERFARSARTSLSSSLRRPVEAKILSQDTVAFADFMGTLSLPTSLHIVQMEPLRGSILVVLEAKLVFCLVDIFMGGSGADPYEGGGREFTSIENRLTVKTLHLLLEDLKEAWKSVQPVSPLLLRSEVNPQFAAIVPPDEPAVVVSVELSINDSTSIVTICFPATSLEPVRDKLQGTIREAQPQTDNRWTEEFRNQLLEVPVEVVAELGRASVTGKEILNLGVGDVIQLNTYSQDRLKLKVGSITKFVGYPGFHRGNQALQIAGVFERRY